ncbi:MAG: Ig-like domain-containing protein [Geobacter sp.]|nr:Ig-like domain-containing protein [Geobacter sp.]
MRTRLFHYVAILLLLAFFCASSAITLADTISGGVYATPVSVALPTQITGGVYSNPVSVALPPPPITGGVYANPVSVALPTQITGSVYTNPFSVAFLPQNMIGPDLVGLWHMDGDWGDSSGNGNHGTPYNGVSFSSSSKVGISSGNFNGANNFVKVKSTALISNLPQSSVEAWIYPTSVSIASGSYLRTIYSENSLGGTVFNLGINGSGKATLGVWRTDVPYNWQWVQSSSVLTANNWYHVVGTIDSSGMKVYVNNLPPNINPANRPSNATISEVGIGRDNNNGGRDYFAGLIDEVAIYKRALTAEEIAAHYAQGATDPNAPAAPAVDPIPAFVGNSTINLSGSRTHNTSIWVNNKKIASFENISTWQGSYGTLAPGANILNVTAVDTSYRQSQPVTRAVYYDNVPPVLESSIPVSGSNTAKVVSNVTIDLYDANAGVDLTGSTQNATVRNAAGQTVPGIWTTSGTTTIVFTPSAPFPQDTYTVAIQPVDAVGNRTAQPQQITFTNHDIAQPVTKITLNGTKDSAGWYSTPVTVTLTADDGADGAGIEKIEFSLDAGATWQVYVTPFVLDTDGRTTLQFRAVDKAGNVEAPAKSQEVKINKTGLVGWWKMDGDWKDSSVVGNNGTPNNGVTFSTSAKIGTNSGSFDGVDDFVEVTNSNGLMPNGSFTLVSWVKFNSFSNTWATISLMQAYRYGVFYHNDAKRIDVARTGDNGDYVYNIYYQALTKDVWYHIVEVYDGSNIKLYIDGQEKQPQTVKTQYIPNMNTNNNPLIGNSWTKTDGNRLNGLIDDIRIYNRALSAQEIQEQYRNYSIGVPTVEAVASPTNVAAITLRGTKPANTAVVVSGATIVPLDANTTWEGSYTLKPGMNNLSVTAMDADGYNSQPATLSVALDTVAPSVIASDPANGGLFRTNVNSVSFTLSDTFSPIDFAATKLNGAVSAFGGGDVNGAWSTSGNGLNGTVTFTPAAPMTEGVYTTTIQPTDVFGNQSTYTIAFTVDATPPMVPTIDSQSAPTRFTSATVTGTKPTDATQVVVACAGATVGSVTYPTATTWSVNLSNLKEGGNSVTAYAVDAAGNQSGAASASITVDLTAPAKPVVNAPASPTRNASVTLTGTKDAGSYLFVNNSQLSVPLNDTAWSYTANLAEGSNGFTLFAKDLAGNQSANTSVTVVRDTTAPALATSTPTNNAYTGTADSIAVTFSDAAAGADLQASLAGAVVKNPAGAVMAGSWSVSGSAIVFTPTTPLPEGVYTVTVYPVDTLGNKGSTSFSFTLDRGPPTLQTLVMNPTSPHRAETVTFTITFSEPMDRAVAPTVTIVKPGIIFDTTYTLTGGWTSDTAWQGSYTFTTGSGDGAWDVRVATARDRAGNAMTPWEQKGSFVLDTTSPDKPTVNAVTTPTRAATQTLTGTKQADTALVINGAVKAPLDSAITWTYSYPLAEGANILTIVARDAAGNDSAFIDPRPAITLDTTPPLFTVDTYKTPAAQPTQVISGKKEPGCVVKLNGAVILDATNQNADWSHTVDLTDSNGFAKKFDFTATDAVGNVTTKSISILYDSAPPAALAAGMLIADGSGPGTTVTLAWPAYVESVDLAYCRIYVATSPFTTIDAMNPVATVNKGTKSYIATGLTQGTTYWFAVVPVDASGNFVSTVNTAQAAPTDTAAPEDVAGLVAWAGNSAANGNYVTLSWTPSQNSTGDLAGQVLYVDAGTGYDAGTPLAAAAANTTVKQLVDARLYKFKLTVKDSGGHESAGATVTAVTRLVNPTGLSGTPGNGKATLTWNAVASPYVRFYNVYRLKSGNQQTDATLMELVKSQGNTSFTDTGLTNGDSYQYAVTTVNTSGAERTDVQSIAVTPRGDIVGPAIGSISITPNQVITAPLTISASATDSESAVARLELWIDGVMVKSQTGASVSWSWNVVETTDGNHTLKVIAYDAPGNATESVIPVVVSLAAPPVPAITTTFGGPITATAVTLAGTTQPGSTVYLRVNGVVVSQFTTNDSQLTNFSFTSVSVSEGDNLVSVKAANRGGESAWSPELRIVVDSGAPAAPVNLAAKPLAGGSIQFTWQAGAGEVPTGYNLYESATTFTAKTDSGVNKTNSAAIPYLLKEYIPADDTSRFYAVTALDGAGNESVISNVVPATSDRSAPSVVGIEYTPIPDPQSPVPVYGPGSVTVRVTVSEALKELPFFSLEPASGSPIVVSLNKIAGAGESYEATITIDATSPQGATTWKFSGKDAIGNRGNGSGTGILIDARGPVGEIITPVKLLKSTGGAVPVTLSLDEQSVAAPSLELRGAEGVTAQVTGLASTDGKLWNGTLDPSTLRDGNAQFVLSGATDRFGNIGSTVKAGGTILVYADAPPAPAVPEGLTAKSGKGGAVILSWSRFGDAEKYRVYRKGENETAPIALPDAAGSQATYTDTPPTDGTWLYSVSALGLLDSESARSGEVSAVSDRIGPPAPTGLILALTGNGVQAAWDAPATGAEVPDAYRLYRSDATISSIDGLTPLITIKTSPAVDTAPASAKRFYAVTSVDALGNDSAPSETREITFPVAPARNILLTRVDDGKPSLSWEAGEGNLQGYYIYRNGARINTTPTSSTSFSDGYYNGGTVTYGVSAVNSLGTESPIKEVALPVLNIGLKEGTTLRRGMLETVTLIASLPADATSGVNIDSVNLKIGALPESTESGPFTVTPGTPLEVHKVAATEATAPPQVAVVTTAILNPSPGTTVKITKSSVASVLGSGTALEIFNDPLVRGTQGKVRIKMNNLGSAQMSFLTSENNGPAGQVKVYLKDQDGNVLAQGNLNQRTGSLVVNSGSYATARLNPGESFLSDPISFAVPSTAPYKVILEAQIQNTYYHYNQPDQVVAPGLKQTIEATISEVAYTAQAQVEKTTYKQGETITITGKALSTADGAPAPGVPVKIGVSVNGFDRYFTATTDQSGNFTYAFTPGASETGTYSVWAIHPDLSDRTVQAQFSIIGLSVSPKLINVTTTRNKPVDVTIAIKNLSGSPLSGFTLAPASSSGIDATVVNAGSNILNGGETRNVTFHLAPQSSAPNTGYASINITTAEGLTDNVEANITLVNAVPVISTSPSYIDTGIVRGNQKIASFSITNTGIETLKNARLEGPSLPWLALTVDKSLGDIGIGQSKSVGILIKPGESVPQGVYDDRLVIYSDNHIPYTYNIQVTVTSNAVGNVQFSVVNELMKDVTDASITIQHQSILELLYTLKTGQDGTASLFDIPEGRYTYNISAPGANPYSGSFVIEPGLTTNVPVALELNLVTVEWSVTPTLIQDSYEIKVSQTYETNVPTPVLITEPPNVTLPEMQPGQVFNGEFTITNYGLIEVFDVEINFPTSFEDYDIEIMTSAIPKTIGAMQKITIPYRITRRVQTAASTSLGEEITGYGGGSCFKTLGIGAKAKCIICPNTLWQRIVEKITSFSITIPWPCPPESPTIVGFPKFTNIVSVVSGGQGSGGGFTGSTPVQIKTGNPCDCKEEGTCVDPGTTVCVGGNPRPVTLTSVIATINGSKKVRSKPLESVSFNGSATGNNCEYQYHWDFGDGGTSERQSPSYVYEAPGIYNITLKVSCKKCGPEPITDSVTVKIEKCSNITIKRKDINLLATDGDRFGHWWVELDNGDSYGWWPNTIEGYFGDYRNWLDAIFSVPGSLNKGREEDPHAGHDAETVFNPIISSNEPYEYTCSEVEECIIKFAEEFSKAHETWEWPNGPNCHSFQIDMMNACGL